MINKNNILLLPAFALILVAGFVLVTCSSSGANPARRTGHLIYPEDFAYKGAFRLPDGSNGSNWEYSGYAMTYYPGGDPSGPDDGYPGSIFAIGHDHQQYVAEISIPVPVISRTKDLKQLNTAKTLQSFTNIKGNMFGELEIPRAGLAYLPPQGSQKRGKLYFAWGQHFQEFQPSHGWCEVDLSSPKTAGPWFFGKYTNYCTNDYLFDIPENWAKKNVKGQMLASGRFRDGNWGGQGPALFACAPWQDGNPPPPNARLKHITPLLLYGIQIPGGIEIENRDSMKMKDFKEADEWSGGAWLTAGKKAAVIFVGTKAIGKCWYGFANGVVWPIDVDEKTVYPKVPPWPYDDRGWWSEDIRARIIFYDPDDLARVAGGTLKTYEPQPYAYMDIDRYLFDPGFNHRRKKRYLVGACCFDRAHGILYVMERRADGEKGLIHVWQLRK